MLFLVSAHNGLSQRAYVELTGLGHEVSVAVADRAPDSQALPAVSYPQPDGLDWPALGELLRPLVAAPGLVGISIADFNPSLDPDGRHARRVVNELAAVLD